MLLGDFGASRRPPQQQPQHRKSYNALRGSQARAAYLKVNSLRSSGEKIIFAGDFNSWQTNRAGDAPRVYLVSQGFYDTVNADKQINVTYPTINYFKTTLSAKAIRLDYVMIKGSKRVLRYENVMNVSTRVDPPTTTWSSAT
jgi:endonuclease/exonuclease/phosphatase family metal-dependent hydrolase